MTKQKSKEMTTIELEEILKKAEIDLIKVKEKFDEVIYEKTKLETAFQDNIQKIVEEEIIIRNVELRRDYKYTDNGDCYEWYFNFDLSIKRNDDGYYDSFDVNVYENCIAANLFSCGIHKTIERPSYFKLITNLANLLKNEKAVCNIRNQLLGPLFLANFINLSNQKAKLETTIDNINDELYFRETEAKKQAIREQLQVGKFLIINNNTSFPSVYRIEKVMNKLLIARYCFVIPTDNDKLDYTTSDCTTTMRIEKICYDILVNTANVVDEYSKAQKKGE